MFCFSTCDLHLLSTTELETQRKKMKKSYPIGHFLWIMEQWYCVYKIQVFTVKHIIYDDCWFVCRAMFLWTSSVCLRFPRQQSSAPYRGVIVYIIIIVIYIICHLSYRQFFCRVTCFCLTCTFLYVRGKVHCKYNILIKVALAISFIPLICGYFCFIRY